LGASGPFFQTSMFITRETDYAVRCVLFLSQKAGSTANVNEISESMTVSKSFVAKILQRLSKRGIVRSTQGIAGGFELVKEPGNVNILEVIEAIQGPAAVNVCAVDERNCDLSSTCLIHPVWIELRKNIEKKLRKESFARLIRRKRKRA
jgi:Rrf2 family protein